MSELEKKLDEKNALTRVAQRQDKKELKKRQTAARKAVRATFKRMRAELMAEFKQQKKELIASSDAAVESAQREKHILLAEKDLAAIHIADTDARRARCQ